MEALPAEWVQIFGGLDVGVMVSIGIIAFILQRSKSVSESVALLVPLVMGALYGMIDALDKQYAFGVHVIKGALLTGGGATVMARVVGLTLKKWWGNGNGNGNGNGGSPAEHPLERPRDPGSRGL